ncbi:hypothetical protein HWD94_09630 [Pseudarthrobacter equi]|uniref:hypothetical protein n=1 Tax=Pseudarthrobacter equi TaxID=728066 RepID=UPI0021BEFE8D|nr:hypothetical protein [Pseudarthrobacter equi]MCT9625382.1 hypothetical protein [Pseudarthrobacter equi]
MTSAEPEARPRPTHPQRAVDSFVLELSARHPNIEVLAPAPDWTWPRCSSARKESVPRLEEAAARLGRALKSL